MTNEYKYQQRRRKRGLHCLVGPSACDNYSTGCLCGCGNRTPPGKKHKRRIIRRHLKNEILKEQSGGRGR